MKWCLMLALVLAHAAQARPRKGPPKHDAAAQLSLNGEKTDVVWSDGDSFRIKSGQWKGKGTRLQGYNTLEAYGPVHSWAEWKAAELYVVALASAAAAASEAWVCTTDGSLDGYQRLLIDCPELTLHMLREGYAVAYEVEGAAPASSLKAQAEAQRAKKGLWAKGTSHGVVTSLHSADEPDAEPEGVYNRVVDTRTGLAGKRPHQRRYATCEQVCEETDGEKSCMVYVPFSRRYKNRPGCLQVKQE